VFVQKKVTVFKQLFHSLNIFLTNTIIATLHLFLIIQLVEKYIQPLHFIKSVG